MGTGKVGDTLNATYAPENATPVEFAWLIGDSATQVDEPVLGATGASLTVTEAMVGKYVKVNVTGFNGSAASATTTAPVQAAATDKISIASAKQVGAAKLEVVFNKAISTSEYDITVTRGTTAQTITTVLDDSATTATITLGTAISDAEYTVKIAKKTDASENAEAKVQGAQAKLKSIDFVGEELILSDSLLKTASVNIQGLNDFDEQVALSGSLTVYSTKGEASYSQADKKITLSLAGSTSFFNVGEQVTVTAVYNQGTNILQVAKPLTVSDTATLKEFELGDIASTRASLKGKRLDLTNLATDTYYFPVKVAKDQYGNDLTAKELDKMMVKSGETGVGAGNLFITANSADGSYAYVTGFTELDDKTIAMNISKGSLNSPGTAIFTITGVSGYQGTQELKIEDDPFIAELSVSAPTLYLNKEAELTLTAKDQYGDAVDLYKFISTTNSTGEPATGIGTSTGKTYQFADFNHLTKGRTSIKFSDAAATLKVSTNTSKKTVSFVYTPKTKGQTIVTVQTATPSPANLTWTVEAEPTPAGVDGTSLATSMLVGDTAALGTNTNINFLDSSGAKIDTKSLGVAYYGNKTKYPQYDADGSFPANTQSTGGLEYYYTVEKTSGTSVNVTAATGLVSAVGTGSSNIKVALYSTEKTTGADKVTLLADKTIKFTVAGSTYDSYKATIASGDELLYVNKDSSDATGFKVIGVDSNGYEIEVSNYSVTVDSGLSVNGQKISGKCSTISAKGSAVATIWAKVGTSAVNSAVATVDVPYDVAAPAPQKTKQTKTAAGVTADTNDTDYVGITSGSLANGIVTLTDGTNTWKMFTVDQYGLTMGNTTWAVAGRNLTSDYDFVSGETYTITSTNDKVGGSWTAKAGGAFTLSVAKSANTTATNEATLVSALQAAAVDGKTTTITLTGTADMSGAAAAAVSVPTGDTLVIAAGASLLDDSTNALTMAVGGNIINNGSFTLDNAFTVPATSTFTNNSVFDAADNNMTVDGKFVNNGTVTTATSATISGTGTVTNNAGATIDLAAGSIDMTAANTFENFGTATAANIAGFTLLGEGSATTATTAFTASVIIPAGEKATITTGTDTVTFNNTGSSDFEASVTDSQHITVLSGDATVTSSAGAVTMTEQVVVTSGIGETGTLPDDLEDAAKAAFGTLPANMNAAYFAGFAGVGTMPAPYVIYEGNASNNGQKMACVWTVVADGTTYQFAELGTSARVTGNGYAWALDVVGTSDYSGYGFTGITNYAGGACAAAIQSAYNAGKDIVVTFDLHTYTTTWNDGALVGTATVTVSK